MSQTLHAQTKQIPAVADIIEIVDENLRQGFAQVPRPVLRAKGLSAKAKLVYICLLDYAWQSDRCFPGQQRLAADVDLSVDSIQRALAELRAFQLIAWKRTGLNKPNVYYLLRLAENPNLNLIASGNRKLRFPETADSGIKKPHQHGDNDTQHKNTQTNNTVVVAGALHEFGISRQVATALSGKYPEEFLLEKLEIAQWLLDSGASAIAKNPAGYLRRAIEQDYERPRGYASAAERAAKSERAKQMALAEREARDVAEHEFQAVKEAARAQVQRQHPARKIGRTGQTTAKAWQTVLEGLQRALNAGNYQVWCKDTVLVACDRKRAVIAAPSRFVADSLRERFDRLIERELTDVLGYVVAREYVALPDLLEDSVGPSALATESPEPPPGQLALG